MSRFPTSKSANTPSFSSFENCGGLAPFPEKGRERLRRLSDLLRENRRDKLGLRCWHGNDVVGQHYAAHSEHSFFVLQPHRAKIRARNGILRRNR